MNEIIRYYINLVENVSTTEVAPIPVVEQEEITLDDIRARLADILHKCRSHSDPTGGDYSVGFEDGLEMAASMIENFLASLDRK